MKNKIVNSVLCNNWARWRTIIKNSDNISKNRSEV